MRIEALTAITDDEAQAVSLLIMEAMNRECCKSFLGPGRTLEHFQGMLQELVKCRHSQYSYSNIQAAKTDQGEIVGVLISYDGSALHSLRLAFQRLAKTWLNRDFSTMIDETHAGELYLDSLAVREDYRHRGIATRLLALAIEKARRQGLPRVGLLVDSGNPNAQRLYLSLGFQYVNDAVWGSHPMRHLQRIVD